MDFTVYYFNSNDTVAGDKFSFGLYFGNHPSDHKKICEECDVEVFEGELINKPCKWTIYCDEDSYFIEIVVQKNDSNIVYLGKDSDRKRCISGHYPFCFDCA